jgi:hypothetical protein
MVLEGRGRGLTMHSEATPSPLASPDSDQHRIDADDSIDVPPASPSVEQTLEVQQELAKLFELVAEHVSQEVSGTRDSFFSFIFGCFSSIVLFSLVLNAHCSCVFLDSHQDYEVLAKMNQSAALKYADMADSTTGLVKYMQRLHAKCTLCCRSEVKWRYLCV